MWPGLRCLGAGQAAIGSRTFAWWAGTNSSSYFTALFLCLCVRCLVLEGGFEHQDAGAGRSISTTLMLLMSVYACFQQSSMSLASKQAERLHTCSPHASHMRCLMLSIHIVCFKQYAGCWSALKTVPESSAGAQLDCCTGPLNLHPTQTDTHAAVHAMHPISLLPSNQRRSNAAHAVGSPWSYVDGCSQRVCQV